MSIKMVSPRDFTLRTRTGHVIFFPANEPVHVPDVVVSEAMAVNILPAADTSNFGDRPAGFVATTAITGTLRDALVFNAIGILVKENDLANFNAGGQPKPAALSALAGIRVSGGELSKYWDRYRENISTNSPMPTHPRMDQVLELQALTTRKQLLEYASEIGFPAAEVTRHSVKEAKELLLHATLNYNEVAVPEVAKSPPSTLVED